MIESIDDILTLREAAELWKIHPSTIRNAINGNKFASKQHRKSGGTWLITKSAMISVYGKKETSIDIYTIGYEGRSIEEFISILLQNDIHIIFDVREIPLSRKKGFSKNSLCEHLAKSNIGYYNFKELGSPKEIREELFSTKDYHLFFKRYQDYLAKHPEALNALETAINSDADKNYCLMCFENNPNECHRTIIAQNLQNSKNNHISLIKSL